MRIAIKVANVDRCVVDNVAGHNIGRKHQAVVCVSLVLTLNIRIHFNAEGMLKGKAVAVAREERAVGLGVGEHIAVAVGGCRTRA